MSDHAKGIIGSRKTPISCLPIRVLWRVGLAALEGALKYGRFDFRVKKVKASDYLDATVNRHIFPWWEGQDIDPDSGMHHLDKAIASLITFRDAMLAGTWIDDRPPRGEVDLDELNAMAAALMDKYADKNPKHYTIADTKSSAVRPPPCGQAANP